MVLSYAALWDLCPKGLERRAAEAVLLHYSQQTLAGLRAHNDQLVSPDVEQSVRAAWQKLAEGIPLAYILGEHYFWNMTLKVTPDTLIPRPDSEHLIVKALGLFSKNQAVKVLDLGTGSGALALALAKERPHWNIIATDCSSAALDVARSNATRHQLQQVQFFQGDWFNALNRTDFKHDFDLILSNPPYLAPDDVHLPDLTHEPLSALVAQANGLADILTITEQAPQFLKSGGYLMVEHGHTQGLAVRQMLQRAGFIEVMTQQDFGHNDRLTYGQLA